MSINKKYSLEELKEFDEIILNKLTKAREELIYYKKQIEELAESPEAKVKGLDDGIGTVETERLYNMANRQQKLLQHLENARLRIKNGTYGVCRESGKLISKARLRAVPHATLTIEAKQKQ